VAASGASVESYLYRLLPARSGEDVEAGSPGTREALQGDLEDQMSRRLGMNPMNVEGFVVGVTTGSVPPVVVFGSFEPKTPAKTVELESGRKAYRFSFDELQVAGQTVGGELWGTPLGGSLSGMVFLPSRSHLERVVEAFSRQEDSGEDGDGPDRLPGSARAETFDRLVGSVGDSSVAVVSPVGSVRALQAMGRMLPVPVPKSVAFGVGSQLKLDIRGDAETLDALEKFIDEKLDRAKSKYASMYETADDSGLGRAVGVTLLYHLSESTLGRLEPRRSEGTLEYDVGLRGQSLTSLVVGLAVASAVDQVSAMLEGLAGASGQSNRSPQDGVSDKSGEATDSEEKTDGANQPDPNTPRNKTR
jgi:hypothetical protein